MGAYRGIMLGQTEDCQVLKDLCNKYNKTSAQILGRWLLQQGCLHIPKSQNKERMIENKKLFDFHLGNREVKSLEKMTNEKSRERFFNTHRKGLLRGSDYT